MSKTHTKKTIRLSIIVPAYNEGAHIYENLLAISDALRGRDAEIIVVDDGSADNTFSECHRASKVRRNIKPVQLQNNEGKGASLFRGFAEARGESIVFFDSDLEIAPHYIVKLLAVMREQDADVVA
ncbi:MAG: glycosyltransferase family 2 protein, partial [Chloroflexi bacterium CFX2]|nr:glycosyltransferase family 2 protein [Chloroflexi bacterium CFX2]